LFRSAAGLTPEKIKYALGPDRPRLRRLDLRSRNGFKRSAQFIVHHQTWRGFGGISGGSTSANRRIVHRHTAGAFTEKLSAEIKCGRARSLARPNYSGTFETLP